MTATAVNDNEGAGGPYGYKWYLDGGSEAYATGSKVSISSRVPVTHTLKLEALDGDLNFAQDNLCLTWADIEGPLVGISAVGVTPTSYQVTLTFSEPASSTSTPIDIVGGELESPFLLFNAATSVVFNVRPTTGDGNTVTVSVPSNFAVDGAGNPNDKQPSGTPISSYQPSTSTLYSTYIFYFLSLFYALSLSCSLLLFYCFIHHTFPFYFTSRSH